MKTHLPLSRSLRSPIPCFAAALVIAFWIFTPQLAASDVKKVNNLARECLSGKKKACSELMQIAVEDKDATIRRSAVAQLTDQALLAKIAMEDEDREVRTTALSTLTDQAQIEKVAREAKDESIRRTAEQTVLARAAVNGTDASVRLSAVEKLMDQTLLATIAQSDSDEGVRKAAVSALARMSITISTVAAEREVYIWQAPPGSGVETSKSKWKISGVLGKGEMGETGPVSPEMGLNGAVMMPGPAPGFNVWYFAPRDSFDHLTLESGSTLNCCNGLFILWRQTFNGPITFIGLSPQSPTQGALDRGSFWATPPNSAGGFLRFHTVLYPGPRGALLLGGMLYSYSDRGMNAWTVPALPVSVTGTIRFPEDRWTLAKPGFNIKRGRLQFDETGVFLMPNTQYLKTTK